MEDEEDDLYGTAAPDASEDAPANGNAPIKAEQMDVSEDSDEDSDDDIQITTERPEGAKQESVPPRAASAKPPARHDRTASIDPSPPSKALKTEHPTATPGASFTTTTTLRGAPTHAGKEGKDYPQIRTSTVNLTANPNWPGVNKPITLLDIDADLADNSKLWRLPGTDQTDFFNYGFDEYTWTQYCVRQQSMAGTIAQQRDEDMQMKAMLGMGGDPTGGAGGMPGMPGPAPPGMPDMGQMMQMMSQGMDPSKMDMGQFMAMMGGGGGTPQPGGGQGFGGPGGGFGGQSPHPQGQFQPPSGPGGGQGFGQGMSMDGMSPQQIAIMQQEQNGMGGQGGGGGRGGRRGRGRGGYY